MATRGGRRPGAGRREGTKKFLVRVTAGEILAKHGEEQAWMWLLGEARKRGNLSAYSDALKYLTNRRDGLPAQAIQVDAKTPIRINLGFTTNGNATGA